MEKKVAIVFTVSEDIDVHELLCAAIHGGGELSFQELEAHVISIDHVPFDVLTRGDGSRS